jgi:hypothetical protein
MTPREKRVVTIGAVVVSLAVVARALPQAAGWYLARRAQLLQQMDLEGRMNAAIAARPAIEAWKDSAEARMNILSHSLIPGTSPAEAIATISAAIGSWAADHAVTVDEMQGSIDSTEVPVKLTMRFTTESDLGGWLEWIDEIERAPVALFVNRLELSADEGPVDAVKRIRSRVELIAWHRADETR